MGQASHLLPMVSDSFVKPMHQLNKNNKLEVGGGGEGLKGRRKECGSSLREDRSMHGVL